jgi:hypothetical protein
MEGEIKAFHDKEKLKQFIRIKPALLQRIFKGILHKEKEDKQMWDNVCINMYITLYTLQMHIHIHTHTHTHTHTHRR